MYRKILVAVDGSATSILALREGLRLAQEGRAPVRLVHVIDVIPHGVAVADPERMRQSIREEGAEILKRALELAHQAGVETETKLLEADWRHFSKAIVDEALRWPADLIVIGTHGRTGLARWVLGSVAEEVIHITPLPILLVRSHESTIS